MSKSQSASKKPLDLKAMMEDAIERAGNPRDAWKDATGFNLVSLGAWLELAAANNVEAVPAVEVASAPVDLLLAGLDERDNQEIMDLYARMNVASRSNTMMRWDVCAPYDLKANLSDGNAAWQPDYARPPFLDDPRAFDLLYEFPDPVMRIWQRPWVKVAQHEGWPIEYRVFVFDSRIIGISNYYPQRGLPNTESVTSDIRQCLAMTERLVRNLPLPVRFPGGPHASWPTDEKSFTADFMRLEDGRIVYLEGGPPFGAGAHPCCFPPQLPWNPSIALEKHEGNDA